MLIYIHVYMARSPKMLATGIVSFVPFLAGRRIAASMKRALTVSGRCDAALRSVHISFLDRVTKAAIATHKRKTNKNVT
jgi:hypothetical protein